MTERNLHRASPAALLGLGLILLAGAGCGGGTAAAREGALADAPEWVARGSRVVEGGMVGVGSVRGVDNAPLARDTALNRARAELAKMLEVYSASLMKDYQASTTAGDMSASDEQQRVEQAVKTFSASLLSGAEQKDLWLDDRTGTWFALVALDFEKSRRVAAAAAQMSGPLRRWVDENGDRVLEDLESDLSEARGDPRGVERPVAGPVAAPPAAEPIPAGARPDWIDGACARDRFLCGVGDGASRADADAAARGALALIFEANVRTVTESFQSAAREASSRTGESWEEVERVSEHALVTSEKLVPMSEIAERWRAPDGRVWALARVDRARAARALTEQIQSLDGVVERELDRAREEAPLERIPALRRALTALGEREAKNADLRVVRFDGRGIRSPVAVQDVLALLAGASRELRFGLALAGQGAFRVRECLEAALTEAGHRLEAVEIDENGRRVPRLGGSFDVVVEGVVRAEGRGRIRGNEVVQTTLVLRILNGGSGRTLRTLTGSEKGTRKTAAQAASTAAFKICQDEVPTMVKEIERAFAR